MRQIQIFNFRPKLLEQFFFLIFASYFYNMHFLSLFLLQKLIFLSRITAVKNQKIKIALNS